jgi:hypothetical protein
MPSIRLVSGFVCSLAIAFAGCGGDKLKVEKVTGVVTMNGKPMEFIHVEFWPDVGPRSFGKTDAEGKFTLQLDDRSREGAVPGRHQVSLKDTWPTKDDYISESGEWVDMSQGKRSRISTRYYDAPKSPLNVNVKTGEANHFELPIDPAGK